MAGKGGGAWKVAYADFVTAMMAFFLVMWITAQSKPVKESIARYFEDPLGSSDRSRLNANEGNDGAAIIGPNEMGGAHTRGLAQTDPNSPAKSDGTSLTARRPPKLRIFYDSDQTRARGTMVLFDETSAEVDDEAREQLDTLAPAIRGKPNKIEVRGHATDRPLPEGSPFKDAWQLSYARCLAVMDHLVDRGVERDRIRLSQEANYEPYSDRRDPEWRRLNSRVEIYATAEFSREFKHTPEGEGGYFGDAEKRLPPAQAVDQAGPAEHSGGTH